MHKTVEIAPLLFQRLHSGINLKNNVAAEFRSKVLETLTEAFVRIGEGKFRAFTMAGLSNAVGDGTVGNHARDQNLLAGEEAHAGSLGKILFRKCLPTESCSAGKQSMLKLSILGG